MRRKNLKGPPWYDKTLHKNTGLYLCLSIYIISIVFVLGQSIKFYVVFLLNKAEEIFLRFFCKKKKTFECSSNPHSLEILKNTFKYRL